MSVTTEEFATNLKIAFDNYQEKLKAFNERTVEAVPTETPQMKDTKARLEAITKAGGEKEQNEEDKANFRASVKDKLSEQLKIPNMHQYAIDSALATAVKGSSPLAKEIERVLTSAEIAQWKALQEKSRSLRDDGEQLQSQVNADERALQRAIADAQTKSGNAIRKELDELLALGLRLTQTAESFVWQLGKTGELIPEHDVAIKKASTILKGSIGTAKTGNGNLVAKGNQISKRWDEFQEKNAVLGKKLETIFAPGELEKAYRAKKILKPNQQRLQQILKIDEELQAINNALNKTPAEKAELVRGCLFIHKQYLSKENNSSLATVLKEKLETLSGQKDEKAEIDAVADYSIFKATLPKSANAVQASIQPLPEAAVATVKGKATNAPLLNILDRYGKTQQLLDAYAKEKQPSGSVWPLTAWRSKTGERVDGVGLAAVAKVGADLSAIISRENKDDPKLPSLIRGCLLKHIEVAGAQGPTKNDTLKKILTGLLEKPEMGGNKRGYVEDKKVYSERYLQQQADTRETRHLKHDQ